MSLSREALENYLNPMFPLGPIDTDRIEDKAVFNALYDETSRAYNFVNEKPSVIIGRKGAGKTAFLKHIKFNGGYDVCLWMNSSEEFLRIANALNKIVGPDGSTFVEQVAEIWEFFIYMAAARSIRSNFKNLVGGGSLIADLVVDDKDEALSEISMFILELVEDLDENSGAKGISRLVANVLKKFLPDRSESLRSLKTSVLEFLSRNNKSAIVLIDTLEKYLLENVVRRAIIEGLMKCVGAFNAQQTRFQIRLCLPGEIYRTVEGISTNVSKDLRNKAILQWHAGDLAALGAQRYTLFLFNNRLLDRKDIEGRLAELSDRSAALEFFDSILPADFQNGFGRREVSDRSWPPCWDVRNSSVRAPYERS